MATPRKRPLSEQDTLEVIRVCEDVLKKDQRALDHLGWLLSLPAKLTAVEAEALNAETALAAERERVSRATITLTSGLGLMMDGDELLDALCVRAVKRVRELEEKLRDMDERALGEMHARDERIRELEVQLATCRQTHSATSHLCEEIIQATASNSSKLAVAVEVLNRTIQEAKLERTGAFANSLTFYIVTEECREMWIDTLAKIEGGGGDG